MTKQVNPILIIGGYGSVGSKAVAILNEYYPEIPLFVAGRNPQKAEKLLEKFDNVTAIAIDLSKKDLGLSRKTQFSAVFLFTNDVTYNAQAYAQRAGIPYVTVTASVAEMGMALACFVNNPQNAAVVLSSQWMGGIADALTIDFANEFDGVDSVKITTIVDPADEVGKESGESEIATIFALNPYSIAVENGNYHWLKNDEEKSYTVRTIDGNAYAGYAFPIADILSLKNAIDAQSIHFYTAEGESYGTKNGTAITHDIVVEITVLLSDGTTKTMRKEIIYPKGQAHMTAFGGFLALEQAMGLTKTIQPNLYLGANLLDAKMVKQRLTEQNTLFIEK